MAIPHTETRVSDRTAERINQRIRRDMEARISFYARSPDTIDGRLAELAEEWDIERVLETQAAGVSLLGAVLVSRSRKWLIVPLAVGCFLLMHAIEGWCPPVEVFRRLGVRTAKEINDERYALRVLRGDFDSINISQQATPEEKARTALNALKDGQ
jgi:hypothetical protein